MMIARYCYHPLLPGRGRYLSTRPLSKVVDSAKEALEGINLKGAVVGVGGFG